MLVFIYQFRSSQEEPVTSTPAIEIVTILEISIQEATVTVTADTEQEAHKIAWAQLNHHAKAKDLLVSTGYRDGRRNGDGTFTVRYF